MDIKIPLEENNVEVVNNKALGRFEIDLGGELALAEYMLEGEAIIFTHTEVPAAHEGKGIASQLAFAALEYAKAQELTVHANCAFFARRHPEYQSITWGY